MHLILRILQPSQARLLILRPVVVIAGGVIRAEMGIGGETLWPLDCGGIGGAITSSLHPAMYSWVK